MLNHLPATPFLAVDRTVLDRNIERVATWTAARGLVLRPHVKTHKCLEIAQRQLAAGARGITVATLGEAEVFAQAGYTDLFIAYPLWLADHDHRLAQLAAQARVTVGFDSIAAAQRLVGVNVTGMVEIDSGHHRSGLPAAAAGPLAARAADAGLTVVGAFTFPGHSYAPGMAAEVAAQEATALTQAANSMRASGIPPQVLSGGSTPSLSATGDQLTETRPGVYVFNDAQQWELGTCSADAIALTCHATVVSHAGGRLVLDSGSKILGADRPPWASGFGRLLDYPQARIVLLSEHHAVADVGPVALPPLGTTVRVVPNHACNAVNLVDELLVFENGHYVQRWLVAARGRNT